MSGCAGRDDDGRVCVLPGGHRPPCQLEWLRQECEIDGCDASLPPWRTKCIKHRRAERETKEGGGRG